jgi:hypothetical protein
LHRTSERDEGETMHVAIDEKRDALTAAMLRALELTDMDTPKTDQQQFVAGFVNLAIHAANGDKTPRDEYLSLVVPALRASRMPLATIMSGMTSVAMGGAVALEGEARDWWMRFAADYTRDLCDRWERAA